MKNYYLLIWTELKNGNSKRHHNWHENFKSAIDSYKIALETSNVCDIIVMKIVADKIDRIKMIESGTPF